VSMNPTTATATSATAPFSLEGAAYQELRGFDFDPALAGALDDCLIAHRRAAQARVGGRAIEPASAVREVSPEALAALLAADEDVPGIAARPEIATAVPFNAKRVASTLLDGDVAASRSSVDALLMPWLRALFAPGETPIFFAAGHFLYAPGAHMGWHTNSAFPGWRLYLTHATDPGDSFFRYRDPDTREITTSPDDRWTLRLFHVSLARPLWHCVYSETERSSLGYIVHPWSVRQAVLRKLRDLPILADL